MFRLAHISDVHLGPMPKVHWTNLLSKRVTGYINWQRNRASEFSSSVLNQLAAHMLTSDSDHIVVTGDLVNLALPEEIMRAKRWLISLGSGENISVICGNHDAYIKGMLEIALKQWQNYIIGDNQVPVENNTCFPLLRRRGPCSLILVNTALPTKPFDATGLFDQAQAEKMEKMLEQEKDNCRVILIHHPPFANATTPSKRLIGDELFREVVKKTGAELILHGHTHLDTREWIDGLARPVPVICVPAGGQQTGGRKPAAHYNWFEIEADATGWNITQSKFGYQPDVSGIARLGRKILLKQDR
jgi:3',5'-cyclic AMP phosphodiesterase CpdA